MKIHLSFMIIGLFTNCSPPSESTTLTTKAPDASLIHVLEPPKIKEVIEYPDYSKFVSPNVRNKPQYITGKDFEDSIFYLGSIMTNDKQKFHIITSFLRVQAAIVKHGHSRIYFLDSSKKTARAYTELDNLPFKLKNNKLYFKYWPGESGKPKIHTVNLDEGPPEVLCIGPEGCFWPQ
jgi:hypothetical protein